MTTATATDEIAELLAKTVPVDDCLEWAGSTNSQGYGLTRHQGRVVSPHRLIFALAHGELESSQHVLHSCDNPPCINLAHLSVGTAHDNMRDMAAKGRGGRSKLTPDQVAQIRGEHYSFGRGRHARSNASELAERYGVAVDTIWDVVALRTWKATA